MVVNMNLLSVVLPSTLQFLHGGWFAVHAIAIAVVFYLGYKVGRARQS